MNLDFALSLLLILSAACYAMLGIRLIASKLEAGSNPIGILFVIIGVWVSGSAVELMSSSYFWFSVGRTGHFVGTALAPVAAYVCFREYTGSSTSLRTIAALSIVPVLSVLLAASNYYHELMWFPPFSNEAGEFLTRPQRWGPWFLLVHLPYSYAVIGAAILSLVAHSSGVARAHRRGLFLLVASSAAPLLAVAAYDLGYGPNTISYVPIVFASMLPIYAWLLIGERLVEFTPLAYETVFQNMQDPVVVIDDQCRVIGLNHTAENMLDVREPDALRTPLEILFGSESPEVFAALDSGQPQKMLTSTGRFLHIQVSPITSERASIRGGKVLMFRDVSDVENAQLEVRRSERLLRTLIDHSVNGIIRLRWIVDDDGSRSLRCIFANAAAGRFLGSTPEALTDITAREIVSVASCGMGIDLADDVHSQFDRAVRQHIGLDVEVHHQQRGEGRWLRMLCEPVGEDFAMTFVDITDGKAKERQMRSMAASDPLTGVLNRRGFEQDASRRLADSSDDASGALLFIDLNDFKQINDRYGHEVGDELLIITADRLRQSLRSRDIIGRPGGDEFVALVPDVDEEVALGLARRLARVLEKPYSIDSERLHCAASIGLALYPQHANTLTGLLREADQAMYRAKARSRDKHVRGEERLEKAG